MGVEQVGSSKLWPPSPPEQTPSDSPTKPPTGARSERIFEGIRWPKFKSILRNPRATHVCSFPKLYHCPNWHQLQS